MANRPFTLESTNVFNETFYNSFPAVANSNPVTVSHAHDHKILDTIRTTVIDSVMPHWNTYPSMPQIQATQAFFPGGVSFSFRPITMLQNGAPDQISLPDYQQPLSLQQQIALKELERESLELLLLQEYLKKRPYRLQFHQNGQTSTTDLLSGPSQIPVSRGMCDFKNISGAVAENLEIDQCHSAVGSGKRLLLTKSPDLKWVQKNKNDEETENTKETQTDTSEIGQEEHSKTDVNEDNSKKKVTFEDDDTKKTEKAKKKKWWKYNKKSKQKCSKSSLCSESSSSSVTDSSDDQ